MTVTDSIDKVVAEMLEDSAEYINEDDECTAQYVGMVLAKFANRLAALRVVPEAVTLEVPHQECYSDPNGDSWLDSPDDAEFVHGRKVGDTYTLRVSHYSIYRTYRVTKAPDDDSDDYEVEPLPPPPAAPSEGEPE